MTIKIPGSHSAISPSKKAIAQGNTLVLYRLRNFLISAVKDAANLLIRGETKTTEAVAPPAQFMSPEASRAAMMKLELEEVSIALTDREIEARYEFDNDFCTRVGCSSKKAALDAVRFLSTCAHIKTKPELLLTSAEINKLQDALSDNAISFTMINNSVSSKGDLVMIRELALSTVSKQEAKYTGSIGDVVNSLSHTRPNIGSVMQGLKGFIDTSAQRWHESSAKNLEDAQDTSAHAHFDKALMNLALDDMSTSDLKLTLSHLEGAFGQRMRSILGLVAQRVPMSKLAQDDEVLLTTSIRFGGVVEGLIVALKEKLDQSTDEPFKDGELINSLEQLKPMEKAALLRVGIREEMLV